jgi:pyrroline-5-carboxylate reductase
MVVDEMRLAATAALNGIGIAYVFRQFVEAHIKSGALKVVLEKQSAARHVSHLLPK